MTKRVLKFEALETALIATNQAATEALTAAGVNPDFISYDTGVLPDSTGVEEGDIGAYFTNDGFLQKVEWDGSDWQEVGEAIPSVRFVVRRISNVEKLKETHGLFDGQIVEVAGYESDGDGGGGKVYWDASSTTDDNGVTVFEVDGVATGRWKRFVRLTIHLRWAGFKGDGTTDDSESIQKCLDAIKTGQILQFPDFETAIVDDEFLVDKKITINGSKGFLKIPDNSSIWEADPDRTTLFKIIKSGVVVDGLNIDGNSRGNSVTENGKIIYYGQSADNIGSTGTTLINVIAGQTGGDEGLTNVTIKNGYFKDSSFVTVNIDGGYSSSFEEWDENDSQFVSNCKVYKNTFENGQRSTLNFTGGAKHCEAYSNTFINPYHQPLRAYRQCISINMHHNKIFVDYDEMDQDLYTNNETDVTRVDIRLGHPTRAPGTVRKCTISDNEVWISGNGEAQAGIRLIQEVYENEVHHNRIYATSAEYGIREEGSDNTFSLNTIFDSLDEGIMYDTDDPKGSKFYSNKLIGCNTRGGSSDGVIRITLDVVAGLFANNTGMEPTSVNNLFSISSLSSGVTFINNVALDGMIVSDGNEENHTLLGENRWIVNSPAVLEGGNSFTGKQSVGPYQIITHEDQRAFNPGDEFHFNFTGRPDSDLGITIEFMLVSSSGSSSATNRNVNQKYVFSLTGGGQSISEEVYKVGSGINLEIDYVSGGFVVKAIHNGGGNINNNRASIAILTDYEIELDNVDLIT